MPRNAVLFTMVSLLFLLFGCRPESGRQPGDSREPEDPISVGTHPAATGNLFGSIVLIDGRQRRLGDKQGVIVSIDGTPFSCVTATDGSWHMDNVWIGTHTISWTKPGFGKTKVVGFVCTGGPQMGPKAFIIQTPQFSVTQLRGTAGEGYVNLQGILEGKLLPACTVRLFLGTTTGVASYPPVYNGTLSFIVTPPASDSSGSEGHAQQASFAYTLDAAAFHAAGITSGGQAYIVAYAEASLSQSYDDPGTGRKVFTTLGAEPSEVVQIPAP